MVFRGGYNQGFRAKGKGEGIECALLFASSVRSKCVECALLGVFARPQPVAGLFARAIPLIMDAKKVGGLPSPTPNPKP